MIPILIAGTLACSVFDVGPVSFLDTTVVCNILPLSVNTVNLFVSDNTITNFVTMTKKMCRYIQAEFRERIVAVLADYAFSSLYEIFLCRWYPPFCQIAIEPKLSPLLKSQFYVKFRTEYKDVNIIHNFCTSSSNPWVISCPMTKPIAA